jgi:hypothetical protein
MKVIKRDVDKRLLAIIVALLFIFVATSVYFEANYSRIIKKYGQNQALVKELAANGVIAENSNETAALKDNILQYREYLDQRYYDLNTLNQKLLAQVNSLQDELRLIKAQVEYQKAKDIGPTAQFKLYQSKTEEISSLKETVAALCAKLKQSNISDPKCSVKNTPS